MNGSVSRRRLLLIGGVGVAGLGASVGVASIGSAPASAQDASSDGPTEADLGFCTDMSAHHIQAMAMCQRVLGRETGDPVQAAAAEVLQTQSIEVGMMRAWLTDWGASTTPPAMVMAWMGMQFYCSLEEMPGFATEDEMRALALAEGVDRGRLWLELMRAHHVAGVEMAEAAVRLAAVEKVVRLATTQIKVQTYEIEMYDLLLATDYA